MPRSMRRPAFPRRCVCVLLHKAEKRPQRGGLIGGGNLPSRGGGTAMRTATQASGTEGTRRGPRLTSRRGRLGYRCLASFRRRIVGTRGGEGRCGSGLGKIRSFGKEETDERGEVNGKWKRAGAGTGRGVRASNAMQKERGGEGRRTCAMAGSWWSRLLLPSLVPHGG